MAEPAIPRDIHLIYPMVRHLGFGTRSSLGLAQRYRDGADAPPADYYTCVHLMENGDCGIYRIRPEMCRDYPDGWECRFVGCTLANRGAANKIGDWVDEQCG